MAYPISRMSGWEEGEGVLILKKGFHEDIMSSSYQTSHASSSLQQTTVTSSVTNTMVVQEQNQERLQYYPLSRELSTLPRLRTCIRQRERRDSSSSLSWGREEFFNWLPDLQICLFNTGIRTPLSLKERNTEKIYKQNVL